eukprot:NODE_472_length_8038_cov_0.413150.p4 type:complete len:289 gc:universal NODE_472_length_8038_cov_0.413150:3959-3093(-)
MQKMVAIGGNGFIGTALKSSKTFKVVPVSRSTIPSINISKDISVLKSQLDSNTIVVNLVGLLNNTRDNTFESSQLVGAKNLVDLLATSDFKKLIHISAIGSNSKSELPYFKTKGLAEEYIFKHLKSKATILRPSIVFGKNDSFFNRFSRMSSYMPIFPIFGEAKFQPVFINDLVSVIESVAANPVSNGKIYEIGGPDEMTYRGIIELVLKLKGRKRMLVNIPESIMLFLAYFLEKLPSKMDIFITRDQLRQLKLNNICGQSNDVSDLKELALKKFRSPYEILPTYISR